MSLLRLEWLRLVRSWRGLGVVGGFVLFGFIGPLSGRYLSELAGRLGHGQLELIVQAPQPVDGIVQFVANAQQLGLIGGVIVALAALNFDAQPDVAVFLRTRVAIHHLLLLRFAVYAVVLSVAFLIGGAIAWVGTDLLIGRLPVAAMVVGLFYGVVFYVYAMAMATLAAALSRNTLGCVFIALGLVLTPAALAVLTALRPWVPLLLGTSVIEIVKNGGIFEPLRGVGVAIVVSAAALWLAVRLMQRREL